MFIYLLQSFFLFTKMFIKAENHGFSIFRICFASLNSLWDFRLVNLYLLIMNIGAKLIILSICELINKNSA